MIDQPPAGLLMAAGQHAGVVERELARCGLRAEGADDVPEAIARLKQGGVAVVVVGVTQPGSEDDAIWLLREVEALDTRVPVIVVSSQDDSFLRLHLLALGAVDYLAPPLDVSRLAFLLDLLSVRSRVEASWNRPAVVDVEPIDFRPVESPVEDLLGDDFLGDGEAMRPLVQSIRAVAPLDTTVFLVGETGTGKTHLARVIHELSPRREAPFVVVHCGAIAASLFESELFGRVRGSFTGASGDAVGKIAAAGDGTLFLDEVDCIPLEYQAKLLRVVEERQFEPVGSSRTQHMQARLVVASNREPQQEVAAGRFRQDLYYRLGVVQLELPPLRDRPEAVLPLAARFLDAFVASANQGPRQFSPDALRALKTYAWPGNVRELRNAVERCVALCGSPSIEIDHLPAPIQDAWVRHDVNGHPHGHSNGHAGDHGCCGSQGHSSQGQGQGHGLADARADAERQRVIEALARNENNRTTAAYELGVSRVTLYKKMRQYGLT